MQLDHILKKFNFNISTPPQGRGMLEAAGKINYPVAAIAIMQHEHVLKKGNFDLLIAWVRERSRGQNICCHFAAFEIPFNFIYNMTVLGTS